MADKRPLILFSGGLDSTYLLWDRLKNHKQDVDILYVDGGQSVVKRHAEMEARKKIIEKLTGPTSCSIVQQYVVERISTKTTADLVMCMKGIQRPQQTAWFLAALATVNPFIHSSVEIAYVLGDDNLHHLADLSEAWRLLLRATRHGCYYDSPPSLFFPLLEKTKEMLMQELPPEILELTWTCEAPDWAPGADGVNAPQACGQCVPCRTLAWDKESIANPLKHDYTTIHWRYMAERGTDAEKAEAQQHLTPPADNDTVNDTLPKLEAPVLKKAAKLTTRRKRKRK